MKLYDVIKNMYADDTNFLQVGGLSEEDYRELGWESPTTPVLKQLSDTLRQWIKAEGLFYRDVRCYYDVEGKTRLWFLVEASKEIEVYTSVDEYLKEKLKAGFDDLYRPYLESRFCWEEGEENDRFKLLRNLVYAQNFMNDCSYEGPFAGEYSLILDVRKSMEKYAGDNEYWILVIDKTKLKDLLTDKTLYERAKDGSKDALKYGSDHMLEKETERGKRNSYQNWMELYLTAAGDTKYSLAQKSGIDKSRILRIMSGEHLLDGLSLKKAPDLAAALCISLDRLTELAELQESETEKAGEPEPAV